MILDVAIAQSRRTKIWKNKKMAWADLVEKLKTTVRTGETYTTYVNASKEFQAEKKDVGGFVGGYLTGGRRTPVTNVAHRQLITLDSDFGTTDAWEDFTFIYGCEAVSYTTHKHCPEAPRLRFIIPLDRPVSREEYEAIARRIAENIGMSYFDSTTFQPQRLMYWPSSSEDGVYLSRYQQTGEFLCADEVLATYVNWRDISEWAMTPNEDISIRSDLKKQGNPTEKPGLIGAFCRAYNCLEAVEEFLPDEYEVVAGDSRMTYKNGSTHQGVVVYQGGDFIYSYHNSDPAHMRLLNAYDLVRIHKFGHLDKDLDVPINKLESFKLMQEYASGLSAVKMEVTLNAFDAFEEFAEVLGSGETGEQKDWMSKMTLNKNGVYDSTINNLVLIINNDDELKGKIKYNSFDGNIYIVADVPWERESKYGPLIDADDASIRHYIERVYGIFNAGKTFDAINIAAIKNNFHPVRDFISSQQWDGVERVESLLIDYMAAEDSKYVREVTKKMLVAAVARVFVPGIKFDTVLTLVGSQGIGKSTFFNTIGHHWFSDSFTTVQGKESFEQLQGNWIIEIAELAGFKKSEVEQIKQFLSKRSDKFRVAYGRRIETFLRQCIMVGTTNESSFLKDYTGNRRFWPVFVLGPKFAKYKMSDMNVEQVWAEAKVLFDAGETLYLDDETEIVASAIQASHTEAEERIGIVERFIETPLPKDWNQTSVLNRRNYFKSLDDIRDFGTEERVSICVAEIWSELFEQDFSKMTSVNTKYIHQMLAQIPGWVKSNSVRNFGPYGRQRAYVKVDGLIQNPDGSKIRGEAKI